jgi:hypothetical protein
MLNEVNGGGLKVEVGSVDPNFGRDDQHCAILRLEKSFTLRRGSQPQLIFETQLTRGREEHAQTGEADQG